MARLLRRNIQDFAQEVPIKQMAQGTLCRCLPWPTPVGDFKVLGGGKGEVKPPKCPARHQGSADYFNYVNYLIASRIEIIKIIQISIYNMR